MHALSKSQRARHSLAALTVVAVVVCIVSCTQSGTGLRATPFPDDLEYLPEQQIQTAMWVLAAEIQTLERLIEEPAELERPSRQAMVIATLDRMHTAAQTLDAPGRTTQHPFLNQNLGSFLGRLERAKRAAEMSPPNYFMAGSVAGSCYLCHGRVHAAAYGIGGTSVGS